MATKGMAVFEYNGEEYTINDPNIAGEYDPAATYAVGALVYRQGDLHMCVTPITTPESWTAAHWTHVDVAGLVNDIKLQLATEASAREDYIKKYGVFDITDGILTRRDTSFNGITYTWNGDICTASGTSTGTSVNLLYNDALPEGMVAGGEYYLNYATSNQSLLLRIICLADEEILSSVVYGGNAYFKVPDGTNTINIALYVASGKTLSGATCGGITISKALDNEILTETALKMYNMKRPASIFELPDSCWYYANGEQMQEILGDSFSFELRPAHGYVITRRTFTDSGLSLFDVESIDRKEKYIGCTSNAKPTDPDWKQEGDENVDRIRARMTIAQADDIAAEIYTDFDLSGEGWYWIDGSILPSSIEQGLHHTNRMSVRPNTDYYIGSVWGHTCYGVFFDAYGNFLAPLKDTDISEYVYDIPDKEPDNPGKASYTYIKLYKFTTPDGAYSFSYNYIEDKDTNRLYYYRQYIASVPVYMHSNTGNNIIRKSDPFYSYFSKRKLCIIGPSYVMIDRLQRVGHFDKFDDWGITQQQYVVGFQEWLMPYWQEVKSYGYSWATYSNYNVEDGAPKRSIYARIVTDQTDISGFDDYIITSNSNDLGENRQPGTVTTYDDLGDNTTYIGAVRQIMEYIYQSNPAARIYLFTHHHHASQYGSDAKWQKMLTFNDEIRNLGKIMGCQVIDFEKNSQFNQFTCTRWNYDYNGISLTSAVHANHEGGRVLGLYCRKEIVGI